MLLGKNLSDEETAEKLMRHRARIMPAFIALFAAIHMVAARDIMKNGSVIDVSMLSWIVMAGVLLVVVATGGSIVMRRPGLREFHDDELMRAHRAKAYTYGFWVMMLGGLAVLLGSHWISAPIALLIHSVLGLGTIAATLRYTMLERHALKQ
ncbi:MAG: hypothetical protein R3E14_01810 [Erythrobacter sp.]